MSAKLSTCGEYRYWLTRGPDMLSEHSGDALFVMLNPSTANALEDDATIRRCAGFAKTWGARWLRVVNLFALRSTDRNGLLSHADPIGPENDDEIRAVAAGADTVVCAWGGFTWVPKRHRGMFYARAEHVRSMLLSRGQQKVFHLGLTKDAQPKHPLYLPADAALIDWVKP